MEYKDGKYHGQGTFTFPDGKKYVLEWKDGQTWNFKTLGTVFNDGGMKLEVGYKNGEPWNWKLYNKEGTLLGKRVNGKQTLNKNKKQ